MTDEELTDGIRALVAEATGRATGVEVTGNPGPDDEFQFTVRFIIQPEKFSFLPLMNRLSPIRRSEYSNRFDEKSWTIAGEFAGRRVSLAFRVEFLRE